MMLILAHYSYYNSYNSKPMVAQKSFEWLCMYLQLTNSYNEQKPVSVRHIGAADDLQLRHCRRDLLRCRQGVTSDSRFRALR